jgi:putative protein kinase ArgK-like GTPase of G3E family
MKSDLLGSARKTAADYMGAMQFVRPKHHSDKWKTKVILASAQTGFNIDMVHSITMIYYYYYFFFLE